MTPPARMAVRSCGCPGTRRDFEAALGRLRERGRFLPVPFSRREVNDRLRRGEHRVLMHQQM